MSKWRKMTWVLWIWSALILVWAIGGGGSAASDCTRETGTEFISASTAQDACTAGAGIAIAFILFIGFVGFVFFSLIWFMTRPKEKAQPVTPTAAPPGFYDDPQGSGMERYWDGTAWTQQTRARGVASMPPPPPPVTA